MTKVTKGMLIAALGLGLGSGASTAMAFDGSYTPGAGILNTVHDLGHAHDGMNYTAMPADSLNRVCIFCHAPHNTYRLSPANGGPGVGGGPQAPDAFDYLPLWNHEPTGNAGSYTMYQNGPGAPTVGAKASQAIQEGTMNPGGASLLCLSCHDGSVAVNSYGNTSQLTRSQSSGGATIGVQYVIGQDNYLGNHHPIGFNYDDVQAADIGIRQADTATLGSAGTVRDHLLGTGNTQMECATCHSVHNKGNTGETLLWRSDTESRLCLTCHDKGSDPGAVTP
ncbi:MAG TPA: cytochrome c3 family protein [Candidatus Binatia bacterium]